MMRKKCGKTLIPTKKSQISHSEIQSGSINGFMAVMSGVCSNYSHMTVNKLHFIFGLTL